MLISVVYLKNKIRTDIIFRRKAVFNMQKQLSELSLSYLQYLSKVSNGVQIITDNLKNGNTSLALSQLVDFSEGIEWLISATKILEENKISTALNLNKLIGFLKLINEGLEKKDYVLVADVLEYEIVEYFSAFR